MSPERARATPTVSPGMPVPRLTTSPASTRPTPRAPIEARCSLRSPLSRAAAISSAVACPVISDISTWGKEWDWRWKRLVSEQTMATSTRTPGTLTSRAGIPPGRTISLTWAMTTPPLLWTAWAIARESRIVGSSFCLMLPPASIRVPRTMATSMGKGLYRRYSSPSSSTTSTYSVAATRRRVLSLRRPPSRRGSTKVPRPTVDSCPGRPAAMVRYRVEIWPCGRQTHSTSSPPSSSAIGGFRPQCGPTTRLRRPACASRASPSTRFDWPAACTQVRPRG